MNEWIILTIISRKSRCTSIKALINTYKNIKIKSVCE